MNEVNFFVATSSVDYMNQALEELRDLDQDIKILETLSNGIMIVSPAIPKLEFNQKILKRIPIFTRHINSVDYEINITESTMPKEILEVFENYKDMIIEGEKIGVQVRKGNGKYTSSPLDFKNEIDTYLSKRFGAISEIKKPEKIISVLLNVDKCYIGLSKAEYNLSDWSGGMIHYKKDENDISRAKFKLMEAIYVFNIDLSNTKTALDLGAAPGGWTSVLLEYGINVTSVDTGDMDSRLLKNKNLKYLKKNVSELEFEYESFDLITSDISWNPINTANMVKNTTRFLRKGGYAVVTVKLMGSKIKKTIREVKEIYSEVFDVIGAKQLFHNRDEITLYMKKR